LTPRTAAISLMAFLSAANLQGTEPVPPLVFIENLRIPIRGEAFQQPRCVVNDLIAGETFVCDTFGNRVVIFDRYGLLEFIIPGGDQFRSPIDIAVDSEGYLFLIGFFGDRRSLTHMDFDGKFISKIELQGLPEELENPNLTSLSISPDGQRFYVVDASNNRLWLLNRQGEIISFVDLEEDRTEEEILNLVLGKVNVYGDTVLLAVPSDGLVYLFDLDGHGENSVGIKGTTPCQTAFPIAAALDEEGTVWVLDKQRALLTRWSRQGNRCLGERLSFGNAPGGLYQPDDLSLDHEGRFFISQGFEGRVQVFQGPVAAALPPDLQGASESPQSAATP